MSTMNIGDILEDVPSIPASISILLRGDHGIGKSSLVRQVAKKISAAEGVQLPVIDRRLSQMTQGDIIGLPRIDDDSTKYLPPDWYVRACKTPVILFLDELNRAETEVMQAAFQIVLDRELNGYRLHEGTRVFCAVNTNSKYNVQAMDPALLDRFFVIDVNFTAEDWVKWARAEGLHDMVIDFNQLNPIFLQPSKKGSAHDVEPSPRSWERLEKTVRPYLDEGDKTGVYDLQKIRRLSAGFVGNEAAMGFLEHIKAEFRFSGEDILNNYTNIRDKVKRHRVDVMVSAAEKLVAYADTLTTVDANQAAQLKAFIWDLEKDHRVTLWQKLARAGNARLPFIRSIHSSVAHAICDAFGVPVGPKGIGVLPNVHGAVQRAEDEKKPA